MSKFDKLQSATEAYKFKNGKTVKSAMPIVPTVLYRVDWQGGPVDRYGSNRNRRDASKVVKFTAIARTDSAVYDDFGRRYLMKACYLTEDAKHAVTVEQLPFKQTTANTITAKPAATVRKMQCTPVFAEQELNDLAYSDIPNKNLEQEARNWLSKPNGIKQWCFARQAVLAKYGERNDKQ